MISPVWSCWCDAPGCCQWAGADPVELEAQAQARDLGWGFAGVLQFCPDHVEHIDGCRAALYGNVTYYVPVYVSDQLIEFKGLTDAVMRVRRSRVKRVIKVLTGRIVISVATEQKLIDAAKYIWKMKGYDE